MKTINKLIVKAMNIMNTVYSVVWITVTGTDKWEYRENSKVHHTLVNIGYNAALRMNGIA